MLDQTGLLFLGSPGRFREAKGEYDEKPEEEGVNDVREEGILTKPQSERNLSKGNREEALRSLSGVDCKIK